MAYIKEKYLYPIVEKAKFLRLFNKTYINRTINKKLILKGINTLEACIDTEGCIIPRKINNSLQK